MQQIGTVNGRAVFKDRNEHLCVEVDGQFLRSLTEEEARLFRPSKQLKNQLVTEDSKPL